MTYIQSPGFDEKHSICTFKCSRCNKTTAVEVTNSSIEDWRNGTYIQQAFHYLTDDQRELFLSGMCGRCYDELFGDDEWDDFLD